METDIDVILRTTAKNMYELLMQVASHVQVLTKENQELKTKISELESK